MRGDPSGGSGLCGRGREAGGGGRASGSFALRRGCRRLDGRRFAVEDKRRHVDHGSAGPRREGRHCQDDWGAKLVPNSFWQVVRQRIPTHVQQQHQDSGTLLVCSLRPGRAIACSELIPPGAAKYVQPGAALQVLVPGLSSHSHQCFDLALASSIICSLCERRGASTRGALDARAGGGWRGSDAFDVHSPWNRCLKSAWQRGDPCWT